MTMITLANFDHAIWRKSSRSGGTSDCVEVAMGTGAVGVRDSKHPNMGLLEFTSNQWRGLIRGVKHGEFDL
jgi:hypothetical protein